MGSPLRLLPLVALLAAGCASLLDLEPIAYERFEDAGVVSPPPQDGGIDVDASDASTPTTCTATFCADFDRIGAFTDVLSQPMIDPGGAIFLDEQASVSAPRSLRARSATRAHARKDLAGAPNTIHLELSLRIHATSTTGVGQPFALAQTAERMLVLFTGPGDLFIQEEGASNVPHPASGPKLTPGNWYRIVLDVGIGTTSALTMSINGTSVLNVPALTRAWTAAQFSFFIGMVYGASGDGSSWDFAFDDVILDLR